MRPMNRLFLMIIVTLATQASLASMPVSFTVVGCVIQGRFVSEGHTFNVDDTRTGTEEPADLAHYEGTTLRIDGMLSPSDHLIGSYVVVDESCKPELHKSAFR